MASATKFICLVGLVVLVSFVRLQNVDAAGECGKSSPDNEAMKMIPCAEAAQDENAPVSATCCTQVRQIGHNPSCLCCYALEHR
ncbi:hypothetical protein ES332_A11G394900v1 [Gossypium tomentosum]|uniref:Uncharacterized protein n=1 Tax=Gossypium tomentosum TaxID=34277 RepID=A0A5D2NK99_GOSTO|nr:hypothetical protein ES332_A11G394900v1 [Gossypium tomentosum]